MAIIKLSECLDFAHLSGDYNPIHISQELNHREITNGNAVHGIFLLLRAIETALSGRLSKLSLASVKCRFLGFLQPEELFDITSEAVSSEGSLEKHRVTVYNNNKALLICEFSIGQFIWREVDEELRWSNWPVKPVPTIAQDIAAQAGSLPLILDQHLYKALFPGLSGLLAPHQVGALCSLTNIVGMRCPGEYSIFDSFDIGFQRSSMSDPIAYQVKRYDQRVNRVSIEVEHSSFEGRLTAFVRPKVVSQANCEEIKKVVVRGQFSGQKALVIGGSRGMGEVLAKLLSMGSAEVTLTYYRGNTESDSVVADIIANGGLAKSASLDVRATEGLEAQLELLDCETTHIYYCATPKIFRGNVLGINRALLSEFNDYYVVSPWVIFNYFAARNLQAVFYPSSSVVDLRHNNMKEYGIAKTAGEAMCDYLHDVFPDVKVFKPRFGKLQTDQTLSVREVNTTDNVNSILNELTVFAENTATY